MSSNRKHGEPQATMKDVFAKFADAGIDVPTETAMGDKCPECGAKHLEEYNGSRKTFGCCSSYLANGTFEQSKQCLRNKLAAVERCYRGALAVSVGWSTKAIENADQLTAMTKERDEARDEVAQLRHDLMMMKGARNSAITRHLEANKGWSQAAKERGAALDEVERLRGLFSEIEKMRHLWVEAYPNVGLCVHYPLASVLAKANESEASE